MQQLALMNIKDDADQEPQWDPQTAGAPEDFYLPVSLERRPDEPPEEPINDEPQPQPQIN